jgi:hypothetical protein
MANLIYQNNPFQIQVTAVDPDNFPGTPLTYLWTQTAGPAIASFSNIFALQPNITCPSAGNYTFQLAVSDGISTTTASIQVTVLPFWTGVQSYTAICPSGTSGTTVIQEATYTSIISLADANTKALTAATIAAEASLQCSSTSSIWTLTVAQTIQPAESLSYNLYVLDEGVAANPIQARLLESYPIDGIHYSAGNIIDYSSIVNTFSNEQIFLWQLSYSVAVVGSGSGAHSITRVYPLENYEVLTVDPSYTVTGKCYSYELPVIGQSLTVRPPTFTPAMFGNTTFIDAPNVNQTNIAIQHNFTSPMKARLWVYNWDQRKAAAGSSTYDYLLVSWISAAGAGGPLNSPITETVLYEQPYSVLSYGENMADADLNYLSLDVPIATLTNAGGVLVVRRGTYDAINQDVVYGANSVVLKAKVTSNTGTLTVSSLSANPPNILGNVNGALLLSSNTTIVDARVATGAFGIRSYNWQSVNTIYNTLVVCQLIGSVGAFTGVSQQYYFTMNTTNSPCNFIEVPLPTAATGVSFACFAANSQGAGSYLIAADSFPLSTASNYWEDIFNDSGTAPFTVSSLPAGITAPSGILPSSANGVFTITDDTRAVLLTSTV